MKSKISIIFILFFAGLISCDKEVAPPNECLKIEIDKDLFDNGIQDPSTVINDILIDDTCLIMSISYGGGCQDHEIMLVTDGLESFSIPPSLNFKLIHENKDPCNAYITENWEFDINSLNFSGNILELIIEGHSAKIIVDLN